VRWCLVAILAVGVVAAHARAGEAATRPAEVDEKLWEALVAIDAKVARIADLTADFRQEKHTSLLKKPLVSSGVIMVRCAVSLWTTSKPEPTVMRIDGKEVKLLYPRQNVLEIYEVGQQMSALATSPLPRLDVLRKHFTYEQIPVGEFVKDSEAADHLALRLRPIDAAIREHVDEVRVLVEIPTGHLVRAETLDPDGDRTVLVFSNMKTNRGLKESDVELRVPAGVVVTRPLEGSGGRESGKQGK
jgi:outer membrane lipoprotein-sorting protein